MLSNIKEKDVENYLKKQAKRLGFFCCKFTSPSTAGVPDRLLIGHGHTFFIELKAPGQKPRPLQVETFKKMQKFGAEIHIADNFEKVDIILNSIVNKNK